MITYKSYYASHGFLTKQYKSDNLVHYILSTHLWIKSDLSEQIHTEYFHLHKCYDNIYLGFKRILFLRSAICMRIMDYIKHFGHNIVILGIYTTVVFQDRETKNTDFYGA